MEALLDPITQEPINTERSIELPLGKHCVIYDVASILEWILKGNNKEPTSNTEISCHTQNEIFNKALTLRTSHKDIDLLITLFGAKRKLSAKDWGQLMAEDSIK